MTISAEDIEHVYPLTPMQEGILFHLQLESELPLYCIQQVYELTGTLELDHLAEACDHLTRQYDILRTGFVWGKQKQSLQVVYRRAKLDLPCHDWREITASDRMERLREFSKNDLHAGFDLRRAPLLRLQVIQVEEQKYYLCKTCHHLITDGTSSTLLMRELAKTYYELAQGRAPHRHKLPPFQHYVQWLKNKAIDDDLQFWREYLGENESELLYLQPNKMSKNRGTDELSMRCSEETSVALTQLARRLHITNNTLVQGIWSFVWSRQSSFSQLLYGITMSSRPMDLPGSERMIGPFIHTVPVKARIKGEWRIASWLQQLQRENVEILEHAHVPLSQIQSCGQSRPGYGMFDALFVFENYDKGLSNGTIAHPSSLQLRRLFQSDATHYPLTVYCVFQKQLTIRFSFQKECFRPRDVRLLRDVFVHCFTRVVELARLDSQLRNTCVKSLMTLPHPHQHALHRWNSRRTPPQDDASVLQRLGRQCQNLYDKVAIIEDGQEIRYGELYRCWQVAAQFFRDRGVKEGDRVGLCMENGVEQWAMVLGIWQIGATYVPIDRGAPPRRREACCRRANLAVLVAESSDSIFENDGRFPLDLIPSDSVFAKEGNDLSESGDSPCPLYPSQTTAYVMFSSGTTGQQKGILVSHQNLRSFFDAIQLHLGFRPGQKWLAISAATFDISWLEWLFVLLHGGQVVVANRQEVRDGERLRTLVEKAQVQWIQATPSMWQMLLDAGWQGTKQDANATAKPGTQLYALSGGEALSTKLATSLRERVSRLWNVYGPTECTVWCTIWSVPSNFGSAVTDVVKIGQPLANSQVSVRDPGLFPLPIGAVGELCVSGECLALAYDHLPKDTASRFVPDPAGMDLGQRIYRSGDLVRWGRDGQLEFMGRIGHQVKIRGHRIELEEIETRLREHRSMYGAVVRVYRHGEGAQLVALVAKSASTTWSEMDQYLAGHLPRIMIPSRWIAVDRIPLNSRGKIDEREVTRRIETHIKEGVEAGPCGGRYEFSLDDGSVSEQLLIGIWSKVLGTNAIDRESNFFTVGGHSLLAMQVIARMRMIFQRDVPVKTIFDVPVLKSLAQWIDCSESYSEHSSLTIRRCQQADYALSFAQQRLWFLHQFEEAKRAYNLVSAIRIRGKFRDDALKRAISSLAERHASLRTRFHVIDGSPRQVILDVVRSPYSSSDLSGYPKEKRKALVDEAILRERNRIFDFESAAPWSVDWIRENVDEGILLLNFHHIIVDGWSLNLLVRDLEFFYQQESTIEAEGSSGETPRISEVRPLPKLVCEVVDHAEWQHRTWGGTEEDEHLRYWLEHLEGAPDQLALPYSEVQNPPNSMNTGRLGDSVTDSIVKGIRDFAKQHDLTPFMVYLAALYILLAKYCRERDICIGTPVSGRHHVDLESVVGNFVNVLVLRGEIDLQRNFLEIAQQVRHITLAGLNHQDLPFERLVRALHPHRHHSEIPLFQVIFAMHQFPNDEFDDGDDDDDRKGPGSQEYSFEVLPISTSQAKSDLVVHAFVGRKRTEIHFEYDGTKFNSQVIRAFRSEYHQLLETYIQAPERPIYQHQFGARCGSSLPTAHNGCFEVETSFVDLVSGWTRQVALNRHEIALIDGLREWTYHDIDQWSTHVARALIAKGVGLESKVGLYMERSTEMLVASLAILKAGACFVPFDANLPKERMWWCLEDCGAQWLLSHRKFATPSNATLEVLDFDQIVADEKAIIVDFVQSLPSIHLHGENLAYIIYTSGSTGQPKGVGVGHRHAVDLLNACQQMYGFDSQDVWTLFHSCAFDFSIWEIWGAWLRGGTLVMVPAETGRNPEAFCTLLNQHSVTVLSQTPSAFYQLAEWVLQSEMTVSSLRVVVFGGEHLDVRRLHGWTQRFGFQRPQLVNMYGITETTIHVSYCSITENSLRDSVGSIGKPLPGVGMSLLDSKLNALPFGAMGEIAVSGVGVSRGYVERPGVTAWRFVPNPRGAPGSRCFRSGDLGRMRSDAATQYHGRLDQQVQLRGHRVELGEITYHLCQYESVASAVVRIVSREDVSLGVGQHLVAYVKWRSGQAADQDGLRAYVRDRLPHYMVPSEIVSIESIPMTRNNKVDESALSRLREADCGSSPRFARTGVEQIVADIWSQSLGKASIGVFEDFFEIGGHSLLAIEVMEQIRSQFGSKLPLTTVFQTPTISSLSQAIVEQAEDQAGRSIILERGTAQRSLQLYCIHPGGGHVRGYQPMARFLSKEGWMVKGIQSRAVIDGEWKADSMASMARDYADLILKECPIEWPSEAITGSTTGGTKGGERKKLPLGLFGWSMGGILAMEIAAILEDWGYRLAFLGIVDAPIMQLRYRGYSKATDVADTEERDLIKHYAIQIGLELQSDSFRRWIAKEGSRLTSALHQTQKEDERLTLMLEAAKSLRLVPESYSLDLCKWRIGVLEEAKALVSHHRPSALQQDIHVWMARSETGENDVRLRLAEFVSGEINIKEVAANHTEIVQSEPVLQGIRSSMQIAEKQWNLAAHALKKSPLNKFPLPRNQE